MKTKDINKMTREELIKYIHLERQKSYSQCCKCGKYTWYKNERTGIGKYENGVYVKLCNLCNDCYANLLEYLEVGDV